MSPLCAWRKNLQAMLTAAGLSDFYRSEAIGKKETFMAIVKRHIKCWSGDTLKAKAEASSKGGFHLFINRELRPGKHCEYLSIADDANAKRLAQFRMRSHRLAIETGSWINLDIGLRQCFTWGEIEDESHVLLDCVRTEDLRQIYHP